MKRRRFKLQITYSLNGTYVELYEEKPYGTEAVMKDVDAIRFVKQCELINHEEADHGKCIIAKYCYVLDTNT